MSFSFREYYGVLVKFPMIFIVLAILILSFEIVRYIRTMKRKSYTNIKDSKARLIYTIICCIAFSLIGFGSMNSKLIFENEEDGVIEQGIITEIYSVGNSDKFIYNNITVSPVWIVINNNEYYIMYIGDYSIGDNVTIEYLPNSMIVLSIHDVE